MDSNDQKCIETVQWTVETHKPRVVSVENEVVLLDHSFLFNQKRVMREVPASNCSYLTLYV